MLDVLVTAVLRLIARRARPDDRARQRRRHQRLERRGVPAPRHLQRRQGLGEQLQRVGGQRVPARGRHGDGAVPGLHEDRVPRADGRRPRLGAGRSCGWTPTSWSRPRCRDFDKGKVISIPSAQYKAITTVARVDPDGRAAALPVHGPQVARTASAATTGVARPERRRAALGEVEQPLVLGRARWCCSRARGRLAEAVVVAGPGHDQRRGCPRSRRSRSPVVGVVVLVVDLDPGQPQPGEPSDDRLVGANSRPCRPHGCASTETPPASSTTRIISTSGAAYRST